LPAIAIGLLSVGVLNLNNMRDEASDRKVGKNTLVVKIGGKSKVIPLLFSLCNGFDGSVCDN
jgi:1,4-dihydroxy-2-naphthoate octaprenyltransferase